MLDVLIAALAIGAPAVQAISAAQNSSVSWLRAVNLTSQMTNAEKANLTTGQGLVSICSGVTGSVPRLNISALCLNDGPAGVRGVTGTSAFPAQVNAASTWDVNLIYQQALAMGAEFRGKGINVALAPVTGGPLGRSPYGGRNWEGYGSDPYLHGIAAYWGVKGIQDNGVIATPKHFIAYEQETYRYTGVLQGLVSPGFPDPSNNTNTDQISSNLDDRTLRELYLWPFEEMMAANPLSIMCSYNRVNGTDACADETLLGKILKQDLEFGGFIVSDWASVFMAASTNGTMNAGLDMDMPGGEGYWGDEIITKVANGTIAQSRLDDATTRILYSYFEAGQDKDYPAVNYDVQTFATVVDGVTVNYNVDVRANHSSLIRKVGEDSAVLLKNVANPGQGQGGLPLANGSRLAIFGTDAGPRPGGPNFGAFNQYPSNSTNNGTIALGSGSGAGHFTYLIDPLSAINQAAMAHNWQVSWVTEDYPANNDTSILSAFDAAITGASTCLVFVSAFSGEGFDRTILRLDNRGDDLIRYVAASCSDTVVVAHVVGATNFETPYLHSNVTALLNAGLPGQESGAALVNLLTGAVNPSGKLVYTILQRDEDYIPIQMTRQADPQANFTEGLLTDYRQADALNLSVRFPFGHGLSYTSFTYANLSLSPLVSDFEAVSNRTSPVMNVTAAVRNVGRYSGAEVSQLYLSFPPAANEPPKVLRGFIKNLIGVNQTRSASFTLRKKDLQIWNVTRQAWQVPRGTFTVRVGASSRNLPLNTTFVY